MRERERERARASERERESERVRERERARERARERERERERARERERVRESERAREREREHLGLVGEGGVAALVRAEKDSVGAYRINRHVRVEDRASVLLLLQYVRP